MVNFMLKKQNFLIKKRFGIFLIFISGSFGFSLFILYKYWKLKKFIVQLDKNVQKLSAELDLLKKKQEEKKNLNELISFEKKPRSRSITRNSSQNAYKTPPTSPEPKKIDFKEEKYEILKQKFLDHHIYFNKKREFYETIEFLRLINALDEKEQDVEMKKKIRFCGFEIAQRCIEWNPESYLSHKWYAIFIGKISDYKSLNEKVKNGFEFKKHLDIAIDMNQSDFILFYLRGRWFHKMFCLSWSEKYAVRFFCRKIPEITIENALNDFLRVEQLNPKKFKSNLLYIVKCFVAQKENEKALQILNEALNLKSQTTEEENDEKELLQFLKK